MSLAVFYVNLRSIWLIRLIWLIGLWLYVYNSTKDRCTIISYIFRVLSYHLIL